MPVITITNVAEERKVELQIAARRAGTNVSEELRRRLPEIILEIQGIAPTKEELREKLSSIHDYALGLARVLELYQRKQFSEAEEKYQALRVKFADG